MDIKEILCHCDHTLLSQTATWEQIRTVLDDGIRYGVASVCLPPSYVKTAKEYVGQQLAICTVIGFPNGYNTTAVKCFECEQALAEGADEIDTVINLGWLKDKEYGKIKEELVQLKAICGDKILKVIIETCLLSEEEKKTMCRVVTEAGADYIKTSTGFSTAGATKEDVKLMIDNVGTGVKVKAAGGISDLDDAEAFLRLGADRLGTSRVVKAVKAAEE
ncbi:MAG: deoxyribose-phosphate aldolase [Ruminococcaceae bacterium]|nr:deoxyribose-phosphate aldolase [Oscillospiraceae bacterium]